MGGISVLCPLSSSRYLCSMLLFPGGPLHATYAGKRKAQGRVEIKVFSLLAAVLDFSNWSLQLLEEWECPRNLFLVLLNNKIEIVLSYRPAW